MGKMLVIAGIVLIIVGLIIQFSGKIPWLGKLPGDIAYEGKDFKFYFPIVTCIVISIIVSLVMYFVRKS